MPIIGETATVVINTMIVASSALRVTPEKAADAGVGWAVGGRWRPVAPGVRTIPVSLEQKEYIGFFEKGSK